MFRLIFASALVFVCSLAAGCSDDAPPTTPTPPAQINETFQGTINQFGRLEVRADVAAAFDAWVQERVGHTVFAGGCRSWYLTDSGRNTQNWPASTLTVRRRLRRLRLDEFVPDSSVELSLAEGRR